MTGPLYIHFGAGKLGLGLLVPQIKKILPAVPLVVLTSQSTRTGQIHECVRNSRKYTLRVGDGAHSTVSDVELKISPEACEIESIFTSADLVIVTTAVGERGLSAVAESLAIGLAARLQRGMKGAIAILPCENIERSGEVLRAKVRKALIRSQSSATAESGVFFCSSIADRMCTGLATDGDNVFVEVEPAARIFTAMPEGGMPQLLIDSVKKIPCLELVPMESMVFRGKQKLWCFNGLHIAAAGRAHVLGIEHLADLLDLPDQANHLAALALDISLALDAWSSTELKRSTFRENHVYTEGVIERIHSHKPDLAMRVLNDFKEFERAMTGELSPEMEKETRHPPLGGKPADHLRLFLSKLDARLLEPAKLILGTNGDGKIPREHKPVVGLYIIDVIKAAERILGPRG